MTVDPSTTEGRRRTRRGLIVYTSTLAALVVQGLLLVLALTDGSPVSWALWPVFLAAAVAGFVVESFMERRRRRS